MKTINDYTIFCTLEQTKKALELGAPVITKPYKGRVIENAFFIEDELMCVFPTAEQMIGWLEEQGIWISILYGYEVIDKWAFDLDGEESRHKATRGGKK